MLGRAKFWEWAVPGLLGLVSTSWRVWMVHDTAGWESRLSPSWSQPTGQQGQTLGLL